MAITHKFYDELIDIENHQTFCGKPINPKSKILFVGTFNPDNESCVKQNNATWFYGRSKSKFWRYMPNALTGNSLHFLDGNIDVPKSWRNYCVQNKLVIIDLVKSIQVDDILENFGDRQVDCKINHGLTNVNRFNARMAFKNITFEKVIYSLSWADNQIHRLKKLKIELNKTLLEIGSIENEEHQIKYCLTPSRNDQKTIDSWNNAINE